ncbi:MAG: shikimate kinase AroL [Candidatus Adiutrix sp.]|jgi:shikimate kinase|nr:shikimate kinase AroL [Candidatus Adiutrix sp.]
MAGNIYLIGPRAAGKSTLGRRLAGALERDFVDCDLALGRRYRQSVAEMLDEGGWELFRRREGDYLAELAAGRGRVVATGGGAVLDGNNCRLMRGSGLVLYLRVPAELLAARLAAEPRPDRRPSLTGRSPAAEAAEVLAAREALYLAAAHQVIDGRGSPEEVLGLILEACRAFGRRVKTFAG